jgi:hypothetical protein
MAPRFLPDCRRWVLLAVAAVGLCGCERVFRATPADRMGYLRELVRARTISRDTLPIDACSIDRFMQGVPAWRDSLVASERMNIAEKTTPQCATEPRPIPGRFVVKSWYRNWSGEYIIRGASYTVAASFPWDQGYRFTDGIFVGREDSWSPEYSAGINDNPRAKDTMSSLLAGDSSRIDSTRKAGTVADTGRDTTRVPTSPR